VPPDQVHDETKPVQHDVSIMWIFKQHKLMFYIFSTLLHVYIKKHVGIGLVSKYRQFFYCILSGIH